MNYLFWIAAIQRPTLHERKTVSRISWIWYPIIHSVAVKCLVMDQCCYVGGASQLVGQFDQTNSIGGWFGGRRQPSNLPFIEARSFSSTKWNFLFSPIFSVCARKWCSCPSSNPLHHTH